METTLLEEETTTRRLEETLEEETIDDLTQSMEHHSELPERDLDHDDDLKDDVIKASGDKLSFYEWVDLASTNGI